MLVESIAVEDAGDRLSETFKILVDHKSDCNAKDQDGFTLLHHAVQRNSLEIVQLLTDLADLNISVWSESLYFRKWQLQNYLIFLDSYADKWNTEKDSCVFTIPEFFFWWFHIISFYILKLFMDDRRIIKKKPIFWSGFEILPVIL